MIWYFNGAIVAVTAAAIRRLILDHRLQTNALQRTETRLTMLLREFEHRSRNSFALIRAISDQTARRSKTINDYRDALHARLAALAEAQSLLLSATGESVPVSSLVAAALKPFLSAKSAVRIVSGPDCAVAPNCATALTLALHELATNAVKYGALSKSGGQVHLSWKAEADGRIALLWRESGGPEVAPPQHEGFGSQPIRNAFQSADESEVFVTFNPDGLHCRMLFRPKEGDAHKCEQSPEPEVFW